MTITKETISTKDAPAAIGPYSQAIRCRDLLFVSGQIALYPETGEFVSGGVEAQTDTVLRNLKAIVDSAGLGMRDIVKTTCYLRDMSDFPAFNKVYEKYFPVGPPARETVAVAGLPRDALIEISCIAVG